MQVRGWVFTKFHFMVCRLQFELSPGQSPLELVSHFVLSPKHGVFVKARKREG